MENPPSPKRSGMESRRVPRVPFTAKVRMKISPRMRSQITLAEGLVLGETIDISSLGAGINCPVFLPKGTKVNCKIPKAAFGISGKGEIAFVGIVKNGRMAAGKPGYRLGVEFERISKRNLTLIEAYVKKNLP